MEALSDAVRRASWHERGFGVVITYPTKSEALPSPVLMASVWIPKKLIGSAHDELV